MCPNTFLNGLSGYKRRISVITLRQCDYKIRQISNINNNTSRILDLQKDRYFETLAAKYWNQTLKAQCPNSDDNEGITLESLGLYQLFYIFFLILLFNFLKIIKE